MDYDSPSEKSCNPYSGPLPNYAPKNVAGSWVSFSLLLGFSLSDGFGRWVFMARCKGGNILIW